MQTSGAFKNIGVILQCRVAPYVAGIERARAATQGLQQSIRHAGEASNEHLTRAGQGAMVMGGLMVAGFGMGARAAMGFEAEMSNVGAVSGATASDLDKLRAAAMRAGEATVFSASEAAKAESELAKAGVSTRDILAGGLTGALDLAAAGQLDLADAATVSAQAMTMFKLSGEDIPHIADLLAAGANKSAADVADMGQALNQSGLVANQFGMSIEETAGTLAMFAQAGLRGSDAGTSLKTMLLALNPKSKEAAQLMDELGVSFVNADGSFKNMAGVAEELRTSLGGMSDSQRNATLETIFGTDAIRAASIMYSAGGEGVQKWTKDVDDAGYAAELAAKKTDNLKGDLEQLGGAFETALINAGTGANGMLRLMTQELTSFVTGLGALPGPLAGVSAGLVGVSGSLIAGAGAFTTMAPKYRQLQESLIGMGPAGSKAATGIRAFTKMAGAGIPALMGVAWWAGKVKENLDSWGDEASKGSKVAANRAFASGWEQTLAEQNNIASQIAAADAEIRRLMSTKVLGVEVGGFANINEIRQLEEWRNGLVGTGNDMYEVIERAKELMRTQGLSGDEALIAAQKHKANQEQIDATGTSTKDLTDKTQDLSGKFGDQAKTVDDARTAFEEYWAAIDNNANTDLEYQQAVRDTKAALKDNGNQMNWMRDEMDLTTEKGAALYEAFMAERDAIVKKGQAEYEATGSTEAARAKVAELTKALKDKMGAAYLSQGAIDKLVFSLGLMPTTWDYSMKLSGWEEVNRQLDVTWEKFSRMFGGGGDGVGSVGGTAVDAIRGARGSITSLNLSGSVGSGGVSGSVNAGTPLPAGQARLAPGNAGRLPGRAAGGPFDAGWTGWVGEHGKELVQFGAPGQVIDHNTSARMERASITPPPGGGGPVSYSVTVNAPNYVGSNQELQKAMERVLPEALYNVRRQSFSTHVPV